MKDSTEPGASKQGSRDRKKLSESTRAAFSSALAGLSILGLGAPALAGSSSIPEKASAAIYTIANRERKEATKLVLAMAVDDEVSSISHRSHRSHRSHSSHRSHYSSSTGSTAGARTGARPTPAAVGATAEETAGPLATITEVNAEERFFTAINDVVRVTWEIHWRDDTEIVFPTGLTYRLDELLEEYGAPLPFVKDKQVRIQWRVTEATQTRIATKVTIVQ